MLACSSVVRRQRFPVRVRVDPGNGRNLGIPVDLRLGSGHRIGTGSGAAFWLGVVVLPDIRGLHPYYVALAERFAEAGLPAVAIDYFGRTAGVAETGTRGEDFDWKTHIPQTTPAGIDADPASGIRVSGTAVPMT